ncbi:MAG: hypothetical protein KDD70_08940 [Bdellovibrionales bacterium]|nr:hypothetical protein [Bdellovibrionales bacterium]
MGYIFRITSVSLLVFLFSSTAFADDHGWVNGQNVLDIANSDPLFFDQEPMTVATPTPTPVDPNSITFLRPQNPPAGWDQRLLETAERRCGELRLSYGSDDIFGLQGGIEYSDLLFSEGAPRSCELFVHLGVRNDPRRRDFDSFEPEHMLVLGGVLRF